MAAIRALDATRLAVTVGIAADPVRFGCIQVSFKATSMRVCLLGFCPREREPVQVGLPLLGQAPQKLWIKRDSR